jgi:putative sterol carrier protein
MSIKEELMAALGSWAAKLDDPNIKEKFKGFNKTLQFNFPDQTFHIIMIFKDQKCTLQEGSAVSKPEIIITSESDVILGITKGEINPLKAFMTKKLKASGDKTDMLKIQLLMKQ